MKKIYIALLLAFYGQSVSMFAQDVWKITADSIKLDNYYGITVANGMVGLVSSPEPLKLSQIVLGETYDVYGRGRVKNFLHGMNMMDVELRIDGTLVTFAKISNFSQTLDMRRGIFGGMFDYKSCVHVEYEYTALRHLPYSCLLSVTVIPHEDVELSVANVLSTHESLRESQESFHRVFNGKIPIDLSTSICRFFASTGNSASNGTWSGYPYTGVLYSSAKRKTVSFFTSGDYFIINPQRGRTQ